MAAALKQLQILRGFNNHFFEFIENMKTYFEESNSSDIDDVNLNKDDIIDINEINLTEMTLYGMKKANPKILIKSWHMHVSKYYDEINKGNLDYFLQKNYKDDLTVLDNTDIALEHINKIKLLIRSMGEEDKKKCVKYIQNLSKLCFIYYNN